MSESHYKDSWLREYEAVCLERGFELQRAHYLAAIAYKAWGDKLTPCQAIEQNWEE